MRPPAQNTGGPGKPRPRAARVRFCVALIVFGLVVGPAWAAEPPGRNAPPADAQVGDYVGQEVMIPMRDGTRLHAEVWRPMHVTTPLPILMQRSPYGFGFAAARRNFHDQFKELADDGFIFVLQDIRGRFGSEGDFVMLRPAATRNGQTDDSTDTYDTIDWAIRSLPDNNGRVGVFGVSYAGWAAAMATVNAHPALKAVSVQAAPEDMFIGDDFRHNGAFRLDYAWEYTAALETDGRTLSIFDFGNDDPYAWFLRQKDLATLDRQALGKPLPTWQKFVDHPDYDAFHRAEVTTRRMPATVRTPTLVVAGWWDQEDFYGPLTIYGRQEKGDIHDRNFLVVGPWNHGGWAHGDGRRFGPYDFGSDTSTFFRQQVQLPWFKHWLKGEGSLDQPEALVFETGSNQWKRFAAWPPKEGISKKKLYLHAGGRLSFLPPEGAADDQPDRFVSDPADPVPYRARPISPVLTAHDSTWPRWLADDQAPFAQRKDVLRWRTATLQEQVTLRGDVMAQLFASTTGTDADWIVKLIDIYPDDESVDPELRGRHQMISNEVFRGRYRTGFEHPRPLEPNAVLAYSIDLHSMAHTFLKGHRIEVQVQSSWFPLVDRNPQNFVPDILKAQGKDFQAQTHAVHHSPGYPSAIVVDVADGL